MFPMIVNKSEKRKCKEMSGTVSTSHFEDTVDNNYEYSTHHHTNKKLKQEHEEIQVNFKVKSNTDHIKIIFNTDRKTNNTRKKVDLTRFYKEEEDKINSHFHKDTLNKIQQAKSILALNSIPGSLLCREKEKIDIKCFITAFFKSKHKYDSALYISGVTGTGKTATVLDVVRQSQLEIKDLKYLYINCIGVPKTKLFTIMYEKLTNKKLGNYKAQVAFKKLLYNQENFKLVLILDEIDAYINKNQKELYNIYNWATEANMCVISIANTLNIYQNFNLKIQSRIGKGSINFSPYKHDQIFQIIKDKLKDNDIFRDIAIKRAASYVSGFTGDFRTVLHILQMALLNFEKLILQQININITSNEDTESSLKQISPEHVGHAIRDLFRNQVNVALNDLHDFDLIILIAASQCLSSHNYNIELNFVFVHELLKKIISLCRSSKVSYSSVDFIFERIKALGERSFIEVEDLDRRMYAKVNLKIETENLVPVVKEREKINWLHSYIF